MKQLFELISATNPASSGNNPGMNISLLRERKAKLSDAEYSAEVDKLMSSYYSLIPCGHSDFPLPSDETKRFIVRR